MTRNSDNGTQPRPAQLEPYVIEMAPGTYSWCSCGRSKREPFCDGSHKGTQFRPVKVTFTEPRTIAWCGCKRTKTPPYCDGTHAGLI
ncbi:MAG: CDGSH iron-sulfur domain-containing protein [Verrucomicrobiae bacterium]|nr:CDGSH iron-sulfur domain-containing protein [Verrucomicrobiae bacterium]